MAVKYAEVYDIYQHLPLQDAPKFTQFGIVGLKICHLATLHPYRISGSKVQEKRIGATSGFDVIIPIFSDFSQFSSFSLEEHPHKNQGTAGL
jgi:hypothetical protein